MVAEAEAAGFDFQADFAGTGIGDGAFDHFDGASCGGDLCNAHGLLMPETRVTLQEKLNCHIPSVS
jgi:hypothetical protein